VVLLGLEILGCSLGILLRRADIHVRGRQPSW
jgi:hypothetical protein